MPRCPYKILNKNIEDINQDDLMRLKEIPESSYVDYKLALPEKLGKHLSAFSNSEGGYILIGVQEDGKTKFPIEFPGIQYSEIQKLENEIERAAKNTAPQTQYSIQYIDIPITQSKVVCIEIWAAQMPPVINSDGVVYYRENDDSKPIQGQNSHTIFSRLFEKSKISKNKLESYLKANYIDCGNVPSLQLHYLTNLYGDSFPQNNIDKQTFKSLMDSKVITFDTYFAVSNGHAAGIINQNMGSSIIPNFYYLNDGNAKLTLPLSNYNPLVVPKIPKIKEFSDKIYGITGNRPYIIDLDYLLMSVMATYLGFRSLIKEAKGNNKVMFQAFVNCPHGAIPYTSSPDLIEKYLDDGIPFCSLSNAVIPNSIYGKNAVIESLINDSKNDTNEDSIINGVNEISLMIIDIYNHFGVYLDEESFRYLATQNFTIKDN